MLLEKVWKRGTQEVTNALLANRYYNWYVFSRRLTDTLREKIEPHYPTTSSSFFRKNAPSDKKTVVAMHNGWTESGGWADRLRGIVSAYLLSKEMGYDFRIHFTHPFPLTLFLEPNTYDWRIDPDDLYYTQPQATPVCLEIGSESVWQVKKQKEYLHKAIEQAQGEQIHIYTNALFAYHELFREAFHALFRPTVRLQTAINEQSEILSTNYVSVSTRFMGVLGDFADTVVVSALPPKQKEQLLNACMEQIRKIHKTHPTKKVLVNSDSTTFLSVASQQPYVHTVPGTICHLDTSATGVETSEETLYQTYEKTLLDFFLIAHAECIYRLEGPWMRPSGFPYAASLVGGKPFHAIAFTL